MIVFTNILLIRKGLDLVLYTLFPNMYPMISYLQGLDDKLSSRFRTFTLDVSSVELPKTIPEALGHPKWKEVVMEEMEALEKDKTW